jgi:S-adenosyl methyltransferase
MIDRMDHTGGRAAMGEPNKPPVEIDTTIPQAARFWDFLLGGKDNYEVDREIGRQVLGIFPQLIDSARADRGFLVRAVTHLVRDLGIRQLLDIGTGLPTVSNTHQVAQAIAKDSRIVYVDNDPIVLAHARALLVSTPEGTTRYLHADVHDWERILRDASDTLDFERPVALMLLGIMNYVLDDDVAYRIVSGLVDALPSGSYLAMSHPTAEVHSEAIEESVAYYNASGAPPIKTRSRAELARFFDGLELLDPGVVSCSLWHPEPSDVGRNIEVTQYCGVARKH